MHRCSLIFALFVVAACGGQPTQAPSETDSGSPDTDAHVQESNAGSGGDAPVDSGTGGSSGSDAGQLVDASAPDAAQDAGQDAGHVSPDAAIADAGHEEHDAAAPDAGTDSGTTPAPECTTGELSCNNLDALKCVAGSWTHDQTCPYVCNDGVCSGACVPGAKRCSDVLAQTCDEHGAWITDETCEFVCSAGSCAGSCEPGSTQCAGKTVQSCDSMGAWQNAAQACQYLCSEGACGGECTPTAQRCMGLDAQTCDEAGQWQTTEQCSFVCNGGSCAGTCNPGALRCNANAAQQCDNSGQWLTTETCANVCGAGQCTGQCVPGSKQCSGSNAQSCDSTGNWQNTASCQFTCSSGSCSGVCTPGTQRCSGTQIETCGQDYQWQTAQACPGAQNAVGQCSANQCTFACNPNFSDCDGNAANGCEVSLQTDSSNCNSCGHSCCGGGACSAGTCQPATVVTGRFTRFEMDATNFYTVASTPNDTVIQKTPRAGGPTDFVTDTKGPVWQILSDNNNLYWSSDQGSGYTNVYSAPISGGATKTITQYTGVKTLARSQQDLFWSYRNPGSPAVSYQSLTTANNGTTVSNSQVAVYSMASDGTYLWYAETRTVAASVCGGQDTNLSVIKRVPVHGGAAVQIDQRCGFMSDLTVDQNRLYFTLAVPNAGTPIYSLPLSGDEAASPLGVRGRSPQSDGTNLYYCTEHATKIPVNGGTVTTLEQQANCLGDLHLDGQCVYFRDYEGIRVVNK